LGFSSSERDKFIAKEQLPIFNGTQQYCLWLGCMGAYDPQGREIIADFARVMQHLGTTFGVLQKEKCTGDPPGASATIWCSSSWRYPTLKTSNRARRPKSFPSARIACAPISTDYLEHALDNHPAPPIEPSQRNSWPGTLINYVSLGGVTSSITIPAYLGRLPQRL